jgi:hypothetical protein
LRSTGNYSAGNGLWNSPNAEATNSSGFSGIGAGFRTESGTYAKFGGNGCWWSSTASDASNAWPRYTSMEMVQHIEMHLKKAEDCLFVANRTNKSVNLKRRFFAKIFIFDGEPHVTSSNLWPIIKFKGRPFSIERSYGNKLPGNSEILSTAEFE